MPFAVPNADMEVIEHGVEFLQGNERRKKARALALRWYERGIRASDGTDMLFCFFVAIEVIISAFAADQGPIPEVEARRKSVEQLLSQLGEAQKDLAAWIKQRTTEPSLGQRFRYYVESAHWDDSVTRTFQDLNIVRNQVAHGDRTVVSHEDAHKAKDLLVRMLKSELGVLGDFAWQKEPRVWGIGLEYFVDIPVVKASE